MNEKSIIPSPNGGGSGWGGNNISGLSFPSPRPSHWEGSFRSSTKYGKIYWRANIQVDLSVALVHHPVLNKHGDTIASALTNLDLHDIARSCKTYGVSTFYVVTPLEDQQVLAQKIIDHWLDGFGGTYNPHRKEAVKLIRVMGSLNTVVDHIRQTREKPPKMVGTSAKNVPGSIRYDKMKTLLFDGDPYLLLFGTAWGLSDELISQVDYFLGPISGMSGYNHLSVRSASAVILDRLLGRND